MPTVATGVHDKTPTLNVFDPRGRSIRSVEYYRARENVAAQARIQRTFYDAAGRAALEWDPRLWTLLNEDPLTPANLGSVYSLSGNTLCTASVDAGVQTRLFGPGNEMRQSWDGRGTRRQVEFDERLRPVSVLEWAAGDAIGQCVERLAYGKPVRGRQDRNQYGQLIRHDDPAGTVWFESFTITGQRLIQVRHFTADPVAPDWPELEADRQRLLEPGEGAPTRWAIGPLGHVLEQTDAKGHKHAISLTLDGQLRETRLQLHGQSHWQCLVRDIRYSAQGQIERETAGNGVQTSLFYRPEDGLLLMRRAQDSSVRVLQELVYGYDRMGNVLSIEDKALPVRYFNNQRIDPISRFIYDSLYQLSEASGWEAGTVLQGPASVGRVDPAAISNYRQTYGYDAGGNLLKLTHVGAQAPGRELNAARYSNRCLPWRNGVPPTEEAIAAAFDASGNLLELDQGQFLTWNLRNQLQSISPVRRASSLNDREVYLYDGSGQRVRKIGSLHTNARVVTKEVRYLPGLEVRSDSGTAEVLQVITPQAGLNRVRVLHWDSAPPSGIANNQYRYSLVDHLNACTLELADDARVISHEMYYPFGETAWFAGGDEVEVSYKTVRYSGKERDATGLYYYGMRYYMPGLERWLNADPAGAADGLNLYWMTRNNPVSFIDDEGAITRQQLGNGLWTPVIATGNDRDVKGATPVDVGKYYMDLRFSAQPTDPRKALSVPDFSRVPISTSLFDPIKGGYSSSVSSQLENRNGGSSFIFSMQRMSYFGAVSGEFNAVKIVDIAAGEVPDQATAVSGYWAPQGGYVDIPIHPKGSDPDFVFTPGFSGCSLTVDQLNDNVLRVRHVEGTKEDAQYNALSAAEHGLGLSAAMEYEDYGFDMDEGTKPLSHMTGFAFMRYDQSARIWNIHYQTVQGVPDIVKTSSRSGFFGRNQSIAVAPERSKVRKTMIKRVTTANRRSTA